jgi:2'-5' RNA ligase
MLTFDDEDLRAAALAADLHERLAALGVYEPERRTWLPHVTVLRFRRRPRLQPALPELEPFVTSDAAAFLSRLRPDGARYEVLESVAVGGR